jgi:putative DNA primase/helicase
MELNTNFDFDKYSIGANEIKAETAQLLKSFEPVPHEQILNRLLQQVEFVDFREQAELKNENEKLSKKHYLVCAVDNILKIAQQNNWGLCRNDDFVYLYNGAYWKRLESETLQTFLGESAEKMGIDKFDARLCFFREHLLKQFLAVGHLQKPETRSGIVAINLKNGTFEIRPELTVLRCPNRSDFITYQLPFEYDPQAEAPLFKDYLNKVQPDKERQNILAEYLGYVFTNTMKLEKTLLLYGTGANGKSVFFEIVNALLGFENVSSYSLQNLTRHDSYQRAELANKLVNYASEINGNLEASIFKQLVSGEPVEARQIYGKPFTMTRYAKLIFNCNELPKDVEQSNAYFRRFLIVPFDVTIPEQEQDRELSHKIIQNELSGVFNWVLEGLKRLLDQKKFTNSEAVYRQIEQYKRQSDSVQMFLEDEAYEKATENTKPLKELFVEYRSYCNDSGYRSCSLKTFGERLRNCGFETQKKNYGQVVFVKKN